MDFDRACGAYWPNTTPPPDTRLLPDEVWHTIATLWFHLQFEAEWRRFMRVIEDSCSIRWHNDERHLPRDGKVVLKPLALAWGNPSRGHHTLLGMCCCVLDYGTQLDGCVFHAYRIERLVLLLSTAPVRGWCVQSQPLSELDADAEWAFDRRLIGSSDDQRESYVRLLVDECYSTSTGGVQTLPQRLIAEYVRTHTSTLKSCTQ